MNTHRALRRAAFGAAAFALLSVGLASDASAIHAEDTPEWVAPAGFFVEPEALIMRFDNGDLDYALTDVDTDSDPEGYFNRLDQDYELGFRLGLGYRWTNRWHIGLRWTSIDDEESAAVDRKPSQGLWATAVAADSDLNGSTDIDHALAAIDQELDIIDIEVGRTWGDLDGHNLSFFFGPRFLQYDQTFQAQYWDGGILMEDVFADSDVDAFGIRVGSEGHVALGRETGWSFFGYLALSALVADTDTFYEDFDVDGNDVVAQVADNRDDTSIGLEAGLGFRWAHTFDTDWTFDIAFGWEVSNYTDIAQLADFVDDIHDGKAVEGGQDLGLDGGFLRFGFTW